MLLFAGSFLSIFLMTPHKNTLMWSVQSYPPILFLSPKYPPIIIKSKVSPMLSIYSPLSFIQLLDLSLGLYVESRRLIIIPSSFRYTLWLNSSKTSSTVRHSFPRTISRILGTSLIIRDKTIFRSYSLAPIRLISSLSPWPLMYRISNTL